MKKLMIILLGFLFTVMLNAQDMKLDELLEKYFKVNEFDRFANVQTLKITGKMIRGGAEFPITAYRKYPDMEFMEIDIQGTKVILSVVGQTGWMIYPSSGSSDPQDLGPDIINNSRKILGFQKSPFEIWNNPFVNWKENGSNIELAGREDLNGTPVYNLKLTFKDNEEVNYYMDIEKLVILKTKQKTMNQGQSIEVEEIFSDYRNIDGFMVPYKLETLHNSSSNTVITFDKIEINVPVDDAIFKKPEVNKK
jgi:hypothetical protein